MIENKDVSTYMPESERARPWIGSYSVFFSAIWRSKNLIWQLFRRDFVGSHRKSFLSLAWIFITPIAGTISWLLLNFIGVLRPGSVGVSYPVYLLVGTSLYAYFVALFHSVSGTLTSGASFINQVKYPHESLFVKQALLPICNFTISFSLVFVIALFTTSNFSWLLLLFPLLLIPATLLATALGLLMSMVYVVISDLTHVMATALGLLIYFSPILYAADSVPSTLAQFLKYNPLTYLICVPRDVILYGEIRNLDGFLYSSLATLAFFLLVVRLFIVGEKKLIEKMV